MRTAFSAVLRLTRPPHGALQVAGRSKSLFSTMKKLLRLDDLAAGGRARGDIFDLLALRVVVDPRPDLPPDQAEAACVQARRRHCRATL